MRLARVRRQLMEIEKSSQELCFLEASRPTGRLRDNGVDDVPAGQLGDLHVSAPLFGVRGFCTRLTLGSHRRIPRWQVLIARNAGPQLYRRKIGEPVDQRQSAPNTAPTA